VVNKVNDIFDEFDLKDEVTMAFKDEKHIIAYCYKMFYPLLTYLQVF